VGLPAMGMCHLSAYSVGRNTSSRLVPGVERLRASGKSVEYLVFDDEGHDVLKVENRVRCYNAFGGRHRPADSGAGDALSPRRQPPSTTLMRPCAHQRA
jgi:hypothetical protein